MKIRSLWVLVISLAATIARPALASFDWSGAERAVATVPHEEVQTAMDEWLGIASITLDARGQITEGHAELNGLLLDWDYLNDPLWLQDIGCARLAYPTASPVAGSEITHLSLFTCVDYQVPARHVSSALGIGALEDLFRPFLLPHEGRRIDVTGARSRAAARASVSTHQAVHNGRWGVSLGRTGRSETFIRVYRDGSQQITHVIWANQ